MKLMIFTEGKRRSFIYIFWTSLAPPIFRIMRGGGRSSPPTISINCCSKLCGLRPVPTCQIMPRKGGTGTLIPASPERFGGGGVFAVQSMMCAKIRSHMLEKVNFGSLREPGGEVLPFGEIKVWGGGGFIRTWAFCEAGEAGSAADGVCVPSVTIWDNFIVLPLSSRTFFFCQG